MITLTKSQPQTTASNQTDYYSGEFDAAIALPPQYTEGEYWEGYLAYTAKTGKVPF